MLIVEQHLTGEIVLDSGMRHTNTEMFQCLGTSEYTGKFAESGLSWRIILDVMDTGRRAFTDTLIA
jgi:hypothetical protein